MRNVRFRMSVLCAALLMFAMLSCSRNEIVDPDNTNTSSYASRVNGFSYFIDANNLTLEQTIPLTFTCDSLSYALSVSGYSYGKASIVIHAGRLQYRSSDLAFNINMAFTFSMRSQPDSITLTFTRFSGRIAFALGGIPGQITRPNGGGNSP